MARGDGLTIRVVVGRNRGAPQTRIRSEAIFSEGVSTRGEECRRTGSEVRARAYATTKEYLDHYPRRHTTWRVGSDVRKWGEHETIFVEGHEVVGERREAT